MNIVKTNARKLYARTATGVATLGVALAPALAFAQDAAPDTSEIEAKFVAYGAAAVTLVIAFAVVLWGVRGAGLLKPKG